MNIKKFIKKHKGILIISIGIIIFVIFALKDEAERRKKMFKHPKFTIGVVISDFHGYDTWGVGGYEYMYYVNGKTFEGSTGYDGTCKRISVGDKFLLIFDSIKISRYASLLCIYPIPDSTRVPADGWRLDELPIEVDIDRIKNRSRK